MIKTRAWPVRAMYMLVAAALVMSLMIAAAPPQMVTAANEVKAQWERVSTPSEAGWVLAPDSMISDYAVASEGEIAYAIVVKWSEQDEVESYYPYLLKSTDHAATWKDVTSGIKKEIDNNNLGDLEELAMVATDGVDPDFLAVAALVDGSFHVFVSNDGGASFADAGEVSHGGTSLVTPYVLRISPEVGVVRDIAIGGVNNAGNGVIFRTTATAGTTGGWQNATVAPYDGWEHSNAVIDVRFAPSWAEDRTILAVTATATAIHLQSGTWTTVRGWNEKADFVPAVVVKGGVTIPLELWRWTAGMALPTDYTGGNVDKRVLWVWVNYLDEGRITNTIYRIDNEMSDVVGPLGQIANEGLWLSHISYWGDINSGKAIAGVLGAGSTPNYGRSLKDLVATCCEGVHVYHNARIQNMDICCDRWTKSCKAPSGRLAMEAFYVTADKAYAVALGGEPPYDETAWSFSFDNGNNWNQLSLIDTWIDYLSDVAVSPDCNKTMLVSVNEGRGCGCDSVWLHAVNLPEASEYSGKWLRTWHGLLQGENWCPFPERGLLRLNPEETTGDTVYMVDRMNSTIYWNDLEGLSCWTRRSTTAVIDNIVDLAVKDASTIYILGNDGKVSMSAAHGAAPSWTDAVDSEVDRGWTIAVHGDEILVGGQDGEVSHSSDGGETFTAMTDLPLDGFVTVAFDSYFDQNDTIYAAVAQFTAFGEGSCDLLDPNGGIFMWVIGESTSWSRIDVKPSTFQLTNAGSELDSHDLAYTGLVLDNADGNTKTSPATGGVLYASYIAEVNGEIVTGVARALTPIIEILCEDCVDWDYLIVGLDTEQFEMMPHALKICGCLTPDTDSKLFAIDGSEDYDMQRGRLGTVWTWEDCYGKQGPSLLDPAGGTVIPADACDCANAPFFARWSRLCDACYYDIQFASDALFENIVWEDTRISPSSAANPTTLIDTVLLPGETYYWRVRVIEAGTGQVVRSWWSDHRTLTVAPAMGTGVNLVAPAMGATNMPRTKIAFVWESIAPADSYDWVLSPNSDLSGAVGQQTGLTKPSYTFTGNLAANTPYYWQVTAYMNGAPTSQAIGSFYTGTEKEYCSPQSGLCFNTEAELREHHEQLQKDALKTPTWVWVVIAIGAVLVIVVIVLIFRTRRV